MALLTSISKKRHDSLSTKIVWIMSFLIRQFLTYIHKWMTKAHSAKKWTAVSLVRGRQEGHLPSGCWLHLISLSFVGYISWIKVKQISRDSLQIIGSFNLVQTLPQSRDLFPMILGGGGVWLNNPYISLVVTLEISAASDENWCVQHGMAVDIYTEKKRAIKNKNVLFIIESTIKSSLSTDLKIHYITSFEPDICSHMLHLQSTALPTKVFCGCYCTTL